MNSIEFWENRYKTGGNSGSGSYDKLEKFKTDVINKFISENNIKEIIDFGFGDGNQIKNFLIDNYIGFDVSKTILDKCKEIYSNDKTKKFYLYSGELIENKYKRELGLSLDVIYHIIEENLYENYMNNLFNLSEKYVIIYSMNKKCGEHHIKGRVFTNYIENNFPSWKLIKKIDQKYPKNSSADFYIYKKF